MTKKVAKEEAPATSIGNASVAMPPSMKPKVVVDRRHKKGKTVMLKRFRRYTEDYNDASESLNESALKALRVATKAHKGQFRKSGGEYIDHPKEVARFVQKFKKSNNLSALIQAAYLHDTIEDTDTTYADLVKQFGALVADMVQELTTDKAASDAIGKGEYIAGKMAKMSSWSLVVKLADRLANVQDIDTRPADFQKKYAAQTRLALKRLRSDRYLSKTHNKIMTAIEKKIKEY
jgi:(p)ppGpp synthase/HD superfamily hydrolase